MLKNIPPILSPELLKVLAEMGHSDRICIGDGNFPGARMAKAKNAIFIRADGHGVPEILDAILQVIPLDTYVDTPAMIMEVGEQDKGLEIPIWNTYKEIIAKYDDRGAAAVGQYERFKFYDEAQDCYCIIQTGETAIYANIILQKGVIKYFMEKLISVISTALPVFLALAMGMMCRSKGFLTRDGVDTLKKVIINLTLPFVLFNSFATAEYSLSALILPVIIFLICTAMLALGFVWVKVSKSGSKVAPFLASGFEAGMLGFSLFALLFPDQSASKFAMLVLGQEIFVFTLYKMLLTGKTSPKAILNDFMTSPTLIAVVLGLIVGASGLYDCFRSWGVSTIIESVTSFISAPTGTIILFAVGFDLVLKEINWKKTGGMVAMRLVIAGVMLGLLILLNRTVLNGMIFEGAAVMLFMLPSPYIIPIFADAAEERVQISSALSALTLITMVLFAVASVVVGIM